MTRPRRVTATLCGVRARLVGLCVLAGAGAVASCSDHQASDAPWTLVRSSPADSTVLLRYFHGSCDRLDRAIVRRSAEVVRVTVRIRSTARVCDDAGRATTIVVRLGGPLGDRRVEGECTPGDQGLCESGSPRGTPTPAATVGPN